MKGYVIFYVEEITDPKSLKDYQNAAHPTLEQHGGKVFVGYGRQEVVEGPPVRGVVSIEFPSYEAAREWYHSAAYQEAKVIRRAAVTCHAVIVEGKA